MCVHHTAGRHRQGSGGVGWGQGSRESSRWPCGLPAPGPAGSSRRAGATCFPPTSHPGDSHLLPRGVGVAPAAGPLPWGRCHRGALTQRSFTASGFCRPGARDRGVSRATFSWTLCAPWLGPRSASRPRARTASRWGPQPRGSRPRCPGQPHLAGSRSKTPFPRELTSTGSGWNCVLRGHCSTGTLGSRRAWGRGWEFEHRQEGSLGRRPRTPGAQPRGLIWGLVLEQPSLLSELSDFSSVDHIPSSLRLVPRD